MDLDELMSVLWDVATVSLDCGVPVETVKQVTATAITEYVLRWHGDGEHANIPAIMDRLWDRLRENRFFPAE